MANKRQIVKRVEVKLGEDYPALLRAIIKADSDPSWWESLRNDRTLGDVLAGEIDILIDDKNLAADLGGSTTQLKRRLARRNQRPTPRIKQLSVWNAALELRHHRTESEGSLAVINELSQLVHGSAYLDETLERPWWLGQLEAHYVFSTCRINPVPGVTPNRLSKVLEILKGLELDSYEVILVRTRLFQLYGPLPSLGESEISRQAIWKKFKGLRERLIALEDDPSISALVAEIYSRNPFEGEADPEGGYIGPVIDTRDPLIRFALNTPQGEFPNVLDVLHLGIWLYSGTNPFGPTDPAGFTESEHPIFMKYHLVADQYSDPAEDMGFFHRSFSDKAVKSKKVTKGRRNQ